MRILAGDLGGTKTRLGVFETGGGSLNLIVEESYRSADHDGLLDIVEDFIDRTNGVVDAACVGIAGPVTGRRVRVTNLPWVVDAEDLGRVAGVERFILLNDLEATAWGLPDLPASDFHLLNEGELGSSGNGAVIAAGTGLGEAGLHWDGRAFEPFACEGGHVSFSPTDDVGDGLLQFLRRRHKTVSWERVLSGPGLADLYRFLLEESGSPEPAWFAEADRMGDPVPALWAAAGDGSCEISVRALQVFSRFYGEEAGNLALKLMATGGVWIGGGIAPKILTFLSDGSFMSGFVSKGRMRRLMEAIPVRVVLDDRAALTGAARYAATTAQP